MNAINAILKLFGYQVMLVKMEQFSMSVDQNARTEQAKAITESEDFKSLKAKAMAARQTRVSGVGN